MPSNSLQLCGGPEANILFPAEYPERHELLELLQRRVLESLAQYPSLPGRGIKIRFVQSANKSNSSRTIWPINASLKGGPTIQSVLINRSPMRMVRVFDANVFKRGVIANETVLETAGSLQPAARSMVNGTYCHCSATWQYSHRPFARWRTWDRTACGILRREGNAYESCWLYGCGRSRTRRLSKLR